MCQRPDGIVAKLAKGRDPREVPERGFLNPSGRRRRSLRADRHEAPCEAAGRGAPSLQGPQHVPHSHSTYRTHTPQVRGGHGASPAVGWGSTHSFLRRDLLSLPWVSRRHPAILTLCNLAGDSYPRPRGRVRDVAGVCKTPTHRTRSAKMSRYPTVAANGNGSSHVASGDPDPLLRDTLISGAYRTRVQ